MGFPFAYDHFAEGEGPDPSFLVYCYPKADNFAANGVAYFKQDILHIEVYTDRKDPALEEQIEAALDKGGIFYDRGICMSSANKHNKVTFNISNVHYTPLSQDNDGKYTWAAPVALPGAVSLSLDPRGSQRASTRTASSITSSTTTRAMTATGRCRPRP